MTLTDEEIRVKRFSVLRGARREPFPRSIPWMLIEPHREQAMINHYQTLERLNERGGLSPSELWHVMHGKRWDNKGAPHRAHITEEDAIEWLNNL